MNIKFLCTTCTTALILIALIAVSTRKYLFGTAFAALRTFHNPSFRELVVGTIPSFREPAVCTRLVTIVTCSRATLP